VTEKDKEKNDEKEKKSNHVEKKGNSKSKQSRDTHGESNIILSTQNKGFIWCGNINNNKNNDNENNENNDESDKLNSSPSSQQLSSAELQHNLLIHSECVKTLASLLECILTNFDRLIIDKYGNYVVQYVMSIDWEGIHEQQALFEKKYFCDDPKHESDAENEKEDVVQSKEHFKAKKSLKRSSSSKSFSHYSTSKKFHLPTSTSQILKYFRTHVCVLACSKYSSNVVERCLVLAEPELRVELIEEIINNNDLRDMVKDPYANYVVAKAWVLCSEGAHVSSGAISSFSGAITGVSRGAKSADDLTNAFKSQLGRFKNKLMIVLPNCRSSPYGKRLYSMVMDNG
jgi:hypothetical protein